MSESVWIVERRYIGEHAEPDEHWVKYSSEYLASLPLHTAWKNSSYEYRAVEYVRKEQL